MVNVTLVNYSPSFWLIYMNSIILKMFTIEHHLVLLVEDPVYTVVNNLTLIDTYTFM